MPWLARREPRKNQKVKIAGLAENAKNTTGRKENGSPRTNNLS